ncbi:MAG: glycosyltransferase family 2 protein [bacterium]|nr:glycosyltransferase family 2 protein [bacterium]
MQRADHAVALASSEAVPRLPGLSAVVPLHDEVENVAAVVAGLRAVLPEVAEHWEVVLVDDGSRDGTGALVDALAAADAGVRVVRHARNRGYGAAIRTGFAAARHGWLFLMDGDGQFDPGELPRLCAAHADADAVVGWRERRADPWVRRVNTAGWNRLVRTLFRLPVRDVNCAFKLLRREALGAAATVADGAMISTELLARLRQRGARIVEVSVTHLPRRAGQASGAAPAVVLRAFLELARLTRELR